MEEERLKETRQKTKRKKRKKRKRMRQGRECYEEGMMRWRKQNKEPGDTNNK